MDKRTEQTVDVSEQGFGEQVLDVDLSEQYFGVGRSRYWMNTCYWQIWLNLAAMLAKDIVQKFSRLAMP